MGNADCETGWVEENKQVSLGGVEELLLLCVKCVDITVTMVCLLQSCEEETPRTTTLNNKIYTDYQNKINISISILFKKKLSQVIKTMWL